MKCMQQVCKSKWTAAAILFTNYKILPVTENSAKPDASIFKVDGT
jgi:hypothetical protein